MIQRPEKTPGSRTRRWLPTPSMGIAGIALFLVLGGSALAGTGLIRASDIATGAVTGRAIRAGAVEPKDLNASTRALFAARRVGNGTGATGATGSGGAAGVRGETGVSGANGNPGVNGINGAAGATGSAGAAGTRGETGVSGANGNPGVNGINGAAGATGSAGAAGARGETGVSGANGTAGVSGANGPNGPNGANGTNGVDGTNGIDGLKGTNGTNGTITPLSAKQGLTALPTASPPVTAVELTLPPGNYVVLAKTQLSQTGAGDSVECVLRSGSTTVDQVAMKTLPALSAIPASLQAIVATTGPSTTLAAQCSVLVANGAANFSSLIAIPTA